MRTFGDKEVGLASITVGHVLAQAATESVELGIVPTLDDGVGLAGEAIFETKWDVHGTASV